MMLTICILIFAPQRIRSIISRHKRRQSSPSESHYRYQLLTALGSDDLSLPLNIYSNIKPS